MELPVILFWLVVLVFGLSLGSFTTCVVYRLPRGLSIFRQRGQGPEAYRSFCPQCRHPLGWRDLVPVFSWLVQAGKCRYCRTAIPARYPLIEVAVLVLVGLIAWRYGITFKSFGMALLIPVLAGFGAWVLGRRPS